MIEGETLPGRSGITDTLFTDCIRRPADGSARDLPVVVLLGARGSGKTWVLKHLRNACRRSVAIPYVFVDCADPPERSVWRLVGKLTDDLHAEKWQEFGPLNFPRVTLGRLAAECPRLPEDRTAQDKLRESLRAMARPKERADKLGSLFIDVSQALDVGQPMVKVLFSMFRFAAESPRLVEYRYRRGLHWYGARFGNSAHSGLSVLADINRRYHDGDPVADQMLCAAFVDDLNDAFARRRKFNCAVLLDNCDDPAGTGFLNLLAELRSGRPGSDPLVVVAASRTVPELTALSHGWLFPWEPDQPGTSRIPDPDQVDYDSWQDNRRSGLDLASWWCPVHLRDLTLPELRQDYVRCRLNHLEFIHRFTVGHPWSARRVHSPGVLPDKLTEDQLLRIPADFAPQAAEYLLADLPKSQREKLMQWSAARDIDTAAAALGDSGGVLRDELEKRLWLIPDNPSPLLKPPRRRPGSPRLHPWLRRILLCELAATPATWSQVQGKLRDYAARQSDSQLEAYHNLACGKLSPVVDYLAGQFDYLDADLWIWEFDAVTDAPRIQPAVETPVAQHDTLLLDRNPHDDGPLNRQDRVRKTLCSMVAARWIWSGQLGDPKASLKDTIADGYTGLADESLTGKARYRGEARTYREMRAW